MNITIIFRAIADRTLNRDAMKAKQFNSIFKIIIFITTFIVPMIVISTKSVAFDKSNCLSLSTEKAEKDCIDHALQETQNEIDANVKRLHSIISKDGIAKLDKLEKVWSEYSTSECEFESAGSIGAYIHNFSLEICLADLAKEHVRRLKAQLECGEGDVTCGNQ